MKTNEDLQKDVQDAMKWQPLLKAAEIGVTAEDGIVTLTGIVDNYLKKVEAETAAKNVAGVKVVVEKIEIKLGSTVDKDDNEIAAGILSAFKWNWEAVNENIKVKVENGWVTLEGVLQWNYQKEAATKSVSRIAGVSGVSNNINIEPERSDQLEKAAIEAALERNRTTDDKKVQVNVSGNQVTLNGIVRSIYQRDEAERIAWNAPGVQSVENKLIIEYN